MSSLVRSRLLLALLLVLAIVGFTLVMTAPAGGPPLEAIVTDEGLDTLIPAGWVRSEQFGFEFHPPGGVAQVFDRWTVARACGPDGCASRSLDEWLEQAANLPTFVQAVAPESDLDIVRDEMGSDHRVMVTRTIADTTIVFVAAFDDGADHYVECGLALSQNGDERLIDEIVDVCRSTESISG